ncbi:unnamed protein product, partial [Heterosigma akashiwo]
GATRACCSSCPSSSAATATCWTSSPNSSSLGRVRQNKRKANRAPGRAKKGLICPPLISVASNLQPETPTPTTAAAAFRTAAPALAAAGASTPTTSRRPRPTAWTVTKATS